MDLNRYRIRESVAIAASPEQVWARVSDLTRIGEASPACTGCEWDDPATAMAQDAWFTGTNRMGEHSYATRCQIDSITPGSAFTFVNHGLDGTTASARWGYEVQPADDGSVLVESWELLPTFEDGVRAYAPDADIVPIADERMAAMHAGITATLEALKAELER